MRCDNPEAGINFVDGSRLSFAGDPGYDGTEGVGPASSGHFGDVWAHCDACLKAQGRRTLDQVFAALSSPLHIDRKTAYVCVMVAEQFRRCFYC